MATKERRDRWFSRYLIFAYAAFQGGGEIRICFSLFMKEMENLFMVHFKSRDLKKKLIQEIADSLTFVGCCKLDLFLSIFAA